MRSVSGAGRWQGHWRGRIRALPPVAQVSKPAVSPIFKSAGTAEFRARAASCGVAVVGPPAGLETRDTADLEVCATGAVRGSPKVAGAREQSSRGTGCEVGSDGGRLAKPAALGTSRGCWRIRFRLRTGRPQSAAPHRSAPVPGRSGVAGGEVRISSYTLAQADVAAAEDGRTPGPQRADRSFPVLSHVCVPAGEPRLAGVDQQLRDARRCPPLADWRLEFPLSFEL